MPFDANDKLLLDGLLPAEASRSRLRRSLRDSAALDWDSIASRAERALTAPLLRFNLAAAGGLDAIPEPARRLLDDSSRTWAARHLGYASEATRLLAAMREAGVDALPLKGAALMLGGTYPQAGLRPAVDLDLLLDPSQLDLAESIAEQCGYREIPGRSEARSRQRLENERNHRWPRRGPGGLLLELHHRAFHSTRAERDMAYAEMRPRARAHGALLLPSPADLALHLLHHTMVDLQSTHAMLRTLADLHFLFAQAPEARAETRALAVAFGFPGAMALAEDALAWLTSERTPLDAPPDAGLALLLETALDPAPDELAAAARWVEYFDLSRHPLRKIGNLASLLFTSRSHLEQLYGAAPRGSAYRHYLRRPLDLLRKSGARRLSLSHLRRILALRRRARTPF